MVALQPHNPALINEAKGEVRGHPVTLRHHITNHHTCIHTVDTQIGIKPICVSETEKRQDRAGRVDNGESIRKTLEMLVLKT